MISSIAERGNSHSTLTGGSSPGFGWPFGFVIGLVSDCMSCELPCGSCWSSPQPPTRARAKLMQTNRNIILSSLWSYNVYEIDCRNPCVLASNAEIQASAHGFPTPACSDQVISSAFSVHLITPKAFLICVCVWNEVPSA